MKFGFVRILIEEDGRLYAEKNNEEEPYEYTDLVYNTETKVIYYMFDDEYLDSRIRNYFAPYINENGKYCRFIDNKIVEIN